MIILQSLVAWICGICRLPCCIPARVNCFGGKFVAGYGADISMIADISKGTIIPVTADILGTVIPVTADIFGTVIPMSSAIIPAAA